MIWYIRYGVQFIFNFILNRLKFLELVWIKLQSLDHYCTKCVNVLLAQWLCENVCVWNFKQLALRCGIKCFVQQSEQFSETECAFSCCKKVNLCCSICHNNCGEGVFIINRMSTGEVCNTFMTNPENMQVVLAYWRLTQVCFFQHHFAFTSKVTQAHGIHSIKMCVFEHTENAERGT
jgi:hypothetical protein